MLITSFRTSVIRKSPASLCVVALELIIRYLFLQLEMLLDRFSEVAEFCRVLDQLLSLLSLHLVLKLLSQAGHDLAHFSYPLSSLDGNLAELLIQTIELLHDLVELLS